MQLQSKSWAALLEIRSLTIRFELVSVVAEKDKVSLIVEGYDPPAMKVRTLWEQCSQHSSYSGACHSIKIIHY